MTFQQSWHPRGYLFLLVFLLQVSIGSAQSPTITTYVGPSLPMSGTQALTQAIDSPRAVVLDGAGGFYVSSNTQNRVYRVAFDGTLTLIAGSSFGFGGDGGSATSAQLANPAGLALDTTGNLYIADSANNRIRKVTTNGVISTVAGTGTAGFSGDSGAATSAQIWSPNGVALDGAGNLYIADTNNHRVRKVSSSGEISTVAGTGVSGDSGNGGPATSAQLAAPISVATDPAGNLYIGGTSGVRRVSAGGIITKVAGILLSGRGQSCQFSGDGGPAISASVCGPSALALDTAGNLYIADRGNQRIRKVSTDGTISTVAGTGQITFNGDGGPAVAAALNNPAGVAVDITGNLYIADTVNHCIRKITIDGVIRTVAGNGTAGFSGDAGPARLALVNYPMSVALDRSLNLYIADTGNNRIRKITSAGIISTIAGTGANGFGGDGGPAISAQLRGPRGVAVDGAGNLYISDSGNSRVRKVSSDGMIVTVAGGDCCARTEGIPATSVALSPEGIAIDAAGNLFIAERQVVRRVTTAGIISTVAGNGTAGFSGDGGPALAAQFDGVLDVAVDDADNLYIVDNGNRRIRKVTSAGIVTTVAGNGLTTGLSFSSTNAEIGDGGPATSAQLYSPGGIALDSAGNLYIADTLYSRIRKVNPDGIITTVAGIGGFGFSGDGGPATSAQLSEPDDVTVDAAGNIYIADFGNSRIRKVTANVVLPLTLTASSPMPSAALGTAYSRTIAASGGSPPYSNWTVVGGNLPPGLALNSTTGTIAGTATGTGSFSFSIRVTDSTGITASAALQISVVGTLTITTTSPLTSGTLGVAYTQMLVPSGGIAPYSWAIAAGNLPAGLVFNSSTGVLSGTPVGINGTFNFTTVVQDGTGVRVSAPFQLTIQPSTTTITLTRAGGFAQVASGGGWKTAMTLINLSSNTVSSQINLYQDDGSPMTLPLTLPQFGLSMTGASINLTLGPNESVVVETEASTAGINTGWADVQSSGPLAGYSIFRFHIAGLPDSEGTAPLDGRLSNSLVLPYDETNGYRTGVALANESGTTQTITAVLLDDNGVQLQTSQLTLRPFGHASFFFLERFAQTSHRLGILQLQSSAGIAGVGLRFSPSGSFTSIPIIR